MKIAVIGAGAAGLVAIKYCVQEGYECEAFEQTEFVGGTWNYTDEVGLDKNGLPVHTSMYKNLRTNLPKEVMMFENFPYREDIEESYITQSQVLEYLNDYADKLKLRNHIRHLKLVTHIEPVESNKWDIDIQDVKTKYTEKKRFDAVIVCNGKYGVPYIPKILGLETFPGSCIHSHDYRSEDPYKDKVVLVIGGGPSGIDIAHRLYQVAKKVFCSFKEIGFRFNFPAGLIRKPLVERINGNTVFFQDESKEEIDAILLCTGFNISYPFLSTKCGIVVEDNYVKNVYKEVINISYPTMAILGIPSAICPFPTAEIQMRFFLAALSGRFILPPKEEMRKDNDEFKIKMNVMNRFVHRKTGNKEREYFDDLAQTANVPSVPIVVTELHDRVKKNRNYGDCFRIIDDKHFIQIA
ncbi:hypothetical protein HHI36_001375 [Cryptolaemus montrouzieri]|uniref:Flavin-containing monooxygenase n=1 Tax=Cryptolaemus montrouzieri TaxID=559131 RepID=A0ABD2P7H1_9CUCU